MKNTTILLVLLFSLAGCANLPARLTPSGLNSTFSFDPGQPFAAYLDHCRSIILAGRTDLDSANRDTILSANLPFELKPDPARFPTGTNGRQRKGIVMVHGLSDSPYMMRTLAEHFRERGFLVRSILLPGHGTRPGDLTEVKEGAWRQALQYAVQDTGRQVENLYLAGFSTGGALAVDYAAQHPGSLTALFLFAPCLQVKSPAARWARLVGLFRTWLEIRDDRDFAKYESFPFNAAAQIVALTDRLKESSAFQPNGLALPVFIALSGEDETVDSAFTLDFFQKRLPNPANRLILYSGNRTPPTFSDQRVAVVTGFLPGRKILSLSHLSLTLPAEDGHYGSQGDYRSCLHYPAESVEYAECSAGRTAWLGEKTAANLQTGLLQRLTWNPRYTLQIDEIDRFILALDPPLSVVANPPSAPPGAPAQAGRCFCSSGL